MSCIILAVWGLLASTDVDKPLLRHIVAPREAIDLCGEWDYRRGVKTEKFSDPSLKWEKVKVPARMWFDIHSEPPKASDGMYRRRFTLTKEQAAKHAEIFFEQACYHTLVIVNGQEAFRSYEWSTPFRCDITPFIKEGENTLEVRCWIDPDYPKSGNDTPVVPGWVWSAFTGICRPVHLELMDPVYISDVRVEPRVVGGKELAVSVCLTNSSKVAFKGTLAAEVEGGRLKVEQWKDNCYFELKPGEGKTVELKKPWPEAHLWNPDDPYLYNLEVRLARSASPTDTYRVRFGFREFRIDGTRVTLNGYPFINRRDSVSLGTVSNNAIRVDDAVMRKMVDLYKSRGFVGMRASPACLYRELEVCDEMGFLVSPLLPTGAGYNRNDSYWPAVSNMVRRAALAFRNHPSMMYWCLFNEFGKNYGVGPWKEQYPKMVAMGDYLKTLDPTTFWTSCGDTELDPVNGNGPGPAPVRSLHYPVNTSWGGQDFPEIGWWYAKGLSGWQGSPTKTKPTFISEDFYHGMNDNVPSMTRWGSDAIYEKEGYIKAWRDAVLMMADGHYCGGLGEWNPWFTSSGVESNLLFTAGELMPTYLVSTRHAFPNLAAGSTFEDDLYVHNQSFSTRKLQLELVYSWMDLLDRREIELTPGGRYDGKLQFDVPKVEGVRVQPISVTANLTLDGSNVFTRVFNFNVVPKLARFPKGAALLAYGETPLRGLADAKNVFTNATAALAAKPKALVVAGAVPSDEGRIVDAWVRKGGRALLFANQNGWSPVTVRSQATHAYAWRRTGGFLKDIPENFFSVWRPTATLDQLVLDMPTDGDAEVLLDDGDSKGILWADAVRFLQGSGEWLVTSLPVEAYFAEEPAAPYLASRLAAEMVMHQPMTDGGYAFLNPKHSLAGFFKQNDFLAPTTTDKAKVVIAAADEDAEKIVALAKRGKTVFVTGVNANSAALLEKIGLGFAPTQAQKLAKGGPDSKPRLVDDRRDWFTHVSSEGLLSGVSNTDLSYSTVDLGYYYRWRLTGTFPIHVDTAPLASGLFSDHALLHPNVMAEVNVGKGCVIPISIDFNRIVPVYPQKALKLWRNLIRNAGARTAAAVERHSRVPLNMNGNVHLWAEPGLDAKVPVWFGNGDDMRYFPVNLCGWSVEANNKCPVQSFPQETLYFGGIPFKLTASDTKRGRSVRIDGATFAAPDQKNGGTRLDRLWILAALEDDAGLKVGDTVMYMLVQNHKDPHHTSMARGAVAKYGEHLGAYRHPIPLTAGRIGWEGHSEKTKKAVLYVFSIENPFDKSIPVDYVSLGPVDEKGRLIAGWSKTKPRAHFAILGACWQKD